MKTLQGSKMPPCPTFGALILALGCTQVACRRTPDKGEPPPPVPTQSACELPRSATMNALPPEVPARAAGHCVDPRIDVRSYGVGAKAPLDSVCTELFNGECELYKTYGLEGVTTLEYAPAVGTEHAVSAVVSEFRTGQGAFGFLTRRILAGGPPAGLTVQPLQLSGQGALGSGVAYIRRGRHVVELTYVSSTQTPEEVDAQSKHVLPELARNIALTLGGDETIPTVARRIALPGVPEFGLDLPPDGLFGLIGTGPYAVAHLSEPAPHRLIGVECADEASAKDTLRLLSTAGGFRKLKGSEVVTLRVASDDRAPEQWYLLRQGRLIVGVGPALGQDAPVLHGKEREHADAVWADFATRRVWAAMRHAATLGP